MADRQTAEGRHLPGFDNLGVCPEHGIMTHTREGRGTCPLCKHGIQVEVRRDDEISSGHGLPTGRLSGQEITQRIESEVMAELLPLMEEYLNDREDGGEMWVTVAQVADGELPMGYTKAQEKWANVIGYTFGSRVKYITKEPDAKDTIQSLKEAGYGAE